jgi:hypothetical protein
MSTPVVAIFNTNDDLVELLRATFENAGFIAVSGHIDDLRRGKLNLPDFLRQHDPKVIVYDIAPPYEPHWQFLEHLRQSDLMRGRQFVVTAINAERVHEVVGTREPIYEVVGKPYDLQENHRAVKEASRARSVDQ